MGAHTVPDRLRLAARRGFIRTTYQAYAASIPTGGVSAAAIQAVATVPDWRALAATAVAALLSPPLAGLASYLSIVARGLPRDYTDDA